MLLEFFEIILAISLFFMVVPYKRRNFWNWLLFISVTACIALFLYKLPSVNSFFYDFSWISYPKIQADFILGGNREIVIMITYLLPILFWLLWLNINSTDELKLQAGVIFVLQLIAVMILFSAQNFIQLMLASSCISILGFCLINDSETKKRFIFYSYIAEMLLFTSLAIVYSQQASISLSALPDFLKVAKHHNWVSLLLLCSVFIKCGVFLFQNYLIALQKISFNRILAVSLLSVPLSGVIIFNKLNILISSYWLPFYYSILGLSVLWGVGGICWRDDIKAKVLYLNMIFFSGGLCFAEELYTIIKALPLLFLLDLALCPINFYSANSIKLSENRLFWNKHKLELLITLIVAFLFISIALDINHYFAFLLSFAVGIILSSTYTIKHQEKNVHTKTLFVPLALIISTIIAFYFYMPFISFNNWKIYTVFVITWLFIPRRFLNLFNNNLQLQDADYFSHIYDMFLISPLRFLGRVLWVLVDFVVIERSLIGRLSATFSVVLNWFYQKQSNGWSSWLWFMLFGLLIISINIGIYAYE